MNLEKSVKTRNLLFFERNKNLFKCNHSSNSVSVVNTSCPRNIVILCSGESALDLTLNELIWLRDNADAIIAVNKTIIYSNLAGLVPSHFFLMDAHTVESRFAVQRAFSFCAQNNIQLTGAVVRKSLAGRITYSFEELIESIKFNLSLDNINSLSDLSSEQLFHYYSRPISKIKFFVPQINME